MVRNIPISSHTPRLPKFVRFCPDEQHISAPRVFAALQQQQQTGCDCSLMGMMHVVYYILQYPWA